MYIQEIAVFAIVAGAAIYLVIRLRNNLVKKDCSKGCGCAEQVHVKK